MSGADAPAWIVLGRSGDAVDAVLLGTDGAELRRETLTTAALAERVRAHESESRPRWVWHDTPRWYADLLAAGVRVERCHDLRLCHAILRDAAAVTDARLRAHPEWDAASAVDAPAPAPALFDLDAPGEAAAAGPPADIAAALAEFGRQAEAIASSAHPGALRLLCAAESAGALVAEEMRAAGLPWDSGIHDAILAETLGPRPLGGGVPVRMAEAAVRVRAALGDPDASLDSPPRLLRSLHRVGVFVQSTSRWELAEHDHPAVAPLLEYKKLARLLSANGWAWLEEWVHDGRFRPVYVPGGVVTGRWASSGGGALQIPRQLRAAVHADPGWTFVTADVAQLEPRVLAAMSRDTALADAARGRDLYAGIVESGVVATRAEAKVAVLGAMYGATTGESGRLLPSLRRAYPKAMGLVDEAAARGVDGGVVSTWLGRTSPAPSAEWEGAQGQATEADASAADQQRARRWAGDRGRFTRNFVVQGTAAEWALSWLAHLRVSLSTLPPVPETDAAPRSGAVFARQPHLAFFLHDEVIVHTPRRHADEVARLVAEAAASAGRLLFGTFPIDFPLDVSISATASKH